MTRKKYCPVGRLAGLTLLAFALVGATRTADARSGKLWSERSSTSGPLAQVPDFRTLAAQVLPCVVSVQVEQKVTSSGAQDFFHDLFRGEVPHEFRGRGIGTGFAIRDDGLILTNTHVVENADSIEVSFSSDGKSEHELSAKVVGTAPEYDVALIQVEGETHVPICYLGDSGDIEIGDWVMAVGNPFGLSRSVSVGIISAKERRNIAPSGRRGLYDFLQTDASINPGNSGGPLINMAGEVVGINTAINAAGSGIGFAIPINMAKSLLPSLRSKGRFTRSWIGIKIQPLTDSLAQTYGLSKAQGALVSEVVPGSPADTGGVREGDIVLGFNSRTVRDQSDLPLYASMAGVGARISLTLWRAGKKTTKNIVLEAFPDEGIKLAEAEGTPTGDALGITVADITPPLQREFRLEQSRGVVIRDVERGSAARMAGLRPGDVVLSLNGKPVRLAREFATAVKGIKSGGTMRLQLRRPGGKLFVALRKP